MSRRVIRLDEAEIEVTQAFERYLAESETAAIRFLNEVRSVTARIRSSPRLYPKIGGEFRRALLDRFPYAIIFRETLYEIQIVAVAHTSRKPQYWRKRKP
jgi:plasmid stabilization system protein ParE